MKVSELNGAQLDYWVARAEGHEAQIVDGQCFVQRMAGGLRFADKGSGGGTLWQPSIDSQKGERIIERNGIVVEWLNSDAHPEVVRGDAYPFVATMPGQDDGFSGEERLEAAMRCYVHSRFGAEVPQ